MAHIIDYPEGTDCPKENLKLVDPQPCSTRSDLSPSKAAVPPLALVVSNVLPVQEKLVSPVMSRDTGFTAEVRKRSPYQYVLVARDPFHYLNCTLPLEMEEDAPGSLAIVCQFPPICDEALNDFVEEDETLLGMTLIQFQMKILEQLLLFCTAHNAPTLLIRATEEQSKGMGIYQELVTYVDKVPANHGTLIQLTIPANLETIHTWGNLMNDVNEKFRRTLWQDQRENPIIRDYLKSNPRLSIVN